MSYNSRHTGAQIDDAIDEIKNKQNKLTFGEGLSLDENTMELSVTPIADTLPIGAIIEWDNDIIPENWLLLNGQAVSRTIYSELFALYGTKYGAGDGATTFNLPDRRTRVAVGKDIDDDTFNILGKTGGEKSHTLSIDEIPSHNHTMSASSENAGDHSHTIKASSDSTGAHTHSTSGTAASNGAHTHSTSGTAASDGGHAHQWKGYMKSSPYGGGAYYVPINGNDVWTPNMVTAGGHTHSVSGTAASAGSHTHSVSGTAASAGGHSHTITASSDSTGLHNHTINVSADNTGGSEAHNNLQPYIVTNFIVKAKLYTAEFVSGMIIDNLDSDSSINALSAKMGKELKEGLNSVYDFNGNNLLTSGTDLDTILTVGNYYGNYYDVHNAPWPGEGFFMLKVYNPMAKGNTDLIIQECTFIGTLTTYKRVYYISDGWSDWICQSDKWSSHTFIRMVTVPAPSSGVIGRITVDYPEGFNRFNTYILSIKKRLSSSSSSFHSEGNFPSSIDGEINPNVQVLLKNNNIEVVTTVNQGGQLSAPPETDVYILMYHVDMMG